MIVEKKGLRWGLTELALLAAALLFLIGVRVWFPVCAVGEHVMSCHWAGEVLKALSVLVLVLCAVHLLLPDGRAKAGMDLALAGLGVLILRLPGGVVAICAGAEMPCRAHTLPACLIFGAAMALLAVADAAFWLLREAGRRHRRSAAEGRP